MNNSRSFAQTQIGAITQEVGIPAAPELQFFEVHNYLTAGSRPHPVLVG